MEKVLSSRKVVYGLFVALLFVLAMAKTALAATYYNKGYGSTDFISMDQYNQIVNVLADAAGDDTSQSATPFHATGVTFGSFEEAIAVRETFKYLYLGERDFVMAIDREGASGYVTDVVREGQTITYTQHISNGSGAYEIYVGWLPGSNPAACVAEHNAAMETIRNIAAYAPEDSYSAYKYFNDWLCQNADYDYSFGNTSYSGYGALCTGSSVCAGYARAFMALCYQTGKYCITVSGTKGGEAHCWNAVWDGNTYKWVDVTWADQTGWIDYSEFMNCMSEDWVNYFTEPFCTHD